MGKHAGSGRTERGRPWQPPHYSPLMLTYAMSLLRTTLTQSWMRSMQPKVSCLPPFKVQRTRCGTTPPNPTRSSPFGTICFQGMSLPLHHHSSNNNSNHCGERWTLKGGCPSTRSPRIGEEPWARMGAWELLSTRGVMLCPLGRQNSKDLDCLIVATDTGLLQLTCLLFDLEWF